MTCLKLVNCRSNILLDKHLSAKLGDFGFAKQISKIVGNRSFMTTKLMAKTLGYNPPEMDEGKVSPKSDVYSYGVVSAYLHTCMYVMLIIVHVIMSFIYVHTSI